MGTRLSIKIAHTILLFRVLISASLFFCDCFKCKLIGTILFCYYCCTTINTTPATTIYAHYFCLASSPLLYYFYFYLSNSMFGSRCSLFLYMVTVFVWPPLLYYYFYFSYSSIFGRSCYFFLGTSSCFFGQTLISSPLFGLWRICPTPEIIWIMSWWSWTCEELGIITRCPLLSFSISSWLFLYMLTVFIMPLCSKFLIKWWLTYFWGLYYFYYSFFWSIVVLSDS